MNYRDGLFIEEEAKEKSCCTLPKKCEGSMCMAWLWENNIKAYNDLKERTAHPEWESEHPWDKRKGECSLCCKENIEIVVSSGRRFR
jgi:hypothetical protein